MVLLEFLFVLEALDYEKGHAEQHGNNEVANQQFAFAGLRCFLRQNNRHRADDKDSGIRGSEPDVELLTSRGEGVEIGEPVDQVGAEHATEEHDFGDQEQPHAKRGGVLLLLLIRELMNQRWIVRFVFHDRNRLAIVQREPPVPLAPESRRSYKPPKLRQESR